MSELRTRPLSIRCIARYWRMNRDKTGAILNAAEWAVAVDNRWTVPISRMPIAYLLDNNLVDLNDVLEAIGTDLPNRASDAPTDISRRALSETIQT